MAATSTKRSKRCAKRPDQSRKRGEREARAGLVDAYVHSGRVGVVVEVNCETDFVARTDEFKTLVHDVALQVAASAPDYITLEDVPADIRDKKLLSSKKSHCRRQTSCDG